MESPDRWCQVPRRTESTVATKDRGGSDREGGEVGLQGRRDLGVHVGSLPGVLAGQHVAVVMDPREQVAAVVRQQQLHPDLRTGQLPGDQGSQFVEAEAAAGAHCDRMLLGSQDPVDNLGIGNVRLVDDDDLFDVVRADIGQHRADRSDLRLRVGVRAIDDVQDEIGLADLLPCAGLPETATPVATDLGPETGELEIKSSSLMRGYLGDAPANAQAFDGGWFRSGDLATLDAEGRIVIRGRTKLLIEVSGYKIDPIEVEETLTGLTAISDVAVAGLPDSRAGNRLVAYVVKGADISADEILRHARSRLSVQKVPAEIAFVEALPRSSTGKLLRARLKDL